MNFKISNTRQVYFVAVAMSLLLSALTIYHYPVFNLDGVLYLKTAHVFLQQGLKPAIAVYELPFYSIVIALVSKLFHLSLIHTAYLLNYVFPALVVMTFLALVKELGASKKLLWLAAFVILAYIDFNHYRADFLRGQGYWFFYLLSIFFLFQYSKSFKWMFAFLWAVSALVAALFRIEGVVLFLLVPFVIFLFPGISFSEKVKQFLKINFILIIMSAVLAIVIILYRGALQNSGQIMVWLGQLTNGLSLIISSLQQMNAGLTNHVMGPIAQHQAAGFLVCGLIGLYFLNIVQVLSLGYLIPLLFAPVKNVLPINRTKHLILIWYVAINLLFTSVFFVQLGGFLSDRYLLPLTLTLLCFVPFGFAYLYERWKQRIKFWGFYQLMFLLTCLLVASMVIGSLYRFGPSKVYIYKSAVWIRKNAPASAKIYTNHEVLGALIERRSGGYEPAQSDYFTYQKITKKPWSGYNYAIFITSNRDKKHISQIEKTMNRAPIQVYYDNHRRDQAYIFRISGGK